MINQADSAVKPPSGSETRHCPHQLASGKRCHELQWSSQAPHLSFPKSGRIVNSRCDLRGVRVGEAFHAGLASKRRRRQRLRGVPWSWDSDGESSSDDIHRPTQVNDSEDDQPLVRPVRVHQTWWTHWSMICASGVSTAAPHSYRLPCLRAWSQPQYRRHQGISARCIELELSSRVQGLFETASLTPTVFQASTGGHAEGCVWCGDHTPQIRFQSRTMHQISVCLEQEGQCSWCIRSRMVSPRSTQATQVDDDMGDSFLSLSDHADVALLPFREVVASRRRSGSSFSRPRSVQDQLGRVGAGLP